MRLLLTFLIIVLLGALASTCFFVVDETEFVIVKHFGNPWRTLVEPGLGVKWPWPIDQLARLDNRLMVLENPGPGDPDKEYLTQDQQAGIGKNVVVTTYTCWRIKPDAQSALRFLETMGDRASAEARLGDAVVSELGAVLGRNDFSVLISVDEAKRAWGDMMEAIRERCRERVADYGIEIVDIRIQRLNFPDQNRRNVFDRMRAERATIATRYRSEGDEQAMEIRAKANRQQEEILAKAREEAAKTRGRADAEAARIYAEAYDQDPEFYEFLRTLEAYEKTFDDTTTLILSAESEFLRLLNRAAPESTDIEKRASERQTPTTRPADE